MQRIGLERFAWILSCDASKRTGADEIDPHRKRKDDDGQQARVHVLSRTEDQPLDGFPDNVQRRQQQQAGLDERGKALHFTVAIEVLRVWGFVRDTNRKISDDGSYQVEDGMQGLGENAEAASNCRKKYFEGYQHHS